MDSPAASRWSGWAER